MIIMAFIALALSNKAFSQSNVEINCDPYVCKNAVLLMEATPNFDQYQWGPPGITEATTLVPEYYYTVTAAGIHTYCVTATLGANSYTDCTTFESMECCSNNPVKIIVDEYLSDLLLQGPLPPRIVIMGTLTIDQNYSFPGVDEIIMLGDSKIEIQNNLVCSMTDIHFHGCEAMWERILTGEYVFLRMSGCTVEDGQYALDVKGNHASIGLTGNRFHRNYIGLRFNDYTPYQFHSFDFFEFTDNEFDCENAVLLPPHAGEISYSGCLVRYCSHFDLPQYSDVRNTFHHMRNGIILYNSNSHIYTYATQFWDIDSQEPDEGYAILAHSNAEKQLFLVKDGTGTSAHDFTNCKYGIYSIGMNTDAQENIMHDVKYGIRVDLSQYCDILLAGNEMYNCHRQGIFLYQNDPVSSARVLENVIQISSDIDAESGIYIAENFNPPGVVVFNNDISLQSGRYGIRAIRTNSSDISNNMVTIYNEDTYAGIFTENSHRISVECNAIAGPGANLGNQNQWTPKGIHVVNTTSSFYICNEMNQTLNGMTFEDYCGNEDIRGNVFGNHHRGLYYNDNAITGVQWDCGNLWTGTYTNGAVHDGGSPVIGQSYYFVKPYLQPTLPPSISAASQWFLLSQSPDPTYECSEQSRCTHHLEFISQPSPDSILTPLDYAIALDSLNFQEFDTELDWTADRNLFAKLYSDSLLLSTSALMQQYYDSTALLSQGLFQQMEAADRQSLSLWSELLTSTEEIRMTISGITDTLRYADSLLNTPLSPQDSIFWSGFKHIQQAAFDANRYLLDSLMAPFKAYRQEQTGSLIIQNTLLPDSALYESNEKTVRTIYYNTVLQGTVFFNDAQISTIREIAAQCPLAGGPGVYFARSLYAGIKDTVYDDKTSCLQAGYLKHGQDGNSLSGNGPGVFQIHPNPATTNLTLIRNRESDENLRVQLRDIEGRLLLSRDIQMRGLSAEIDLQSVPAGLYFLQIIANMGSRLTYKVVIIK